MSNDSEKQTDLLLIGTTGVGKSSTGNSILGSQEFQVSSIMPSVTREVTAGLSRRQGRIIRVVDGLELFEAKLSKRQSVEKMVKDMSKAFEWCAQGFHSLLLVCRFGTRFTKEELDTIRALNEIFGQDFLREFCILVITHGELFGMENQDFPGRTFQDWCQEQDGSFKDLLQECDSRVVLFHNRMPGKQESDLQALIEKVDTLRHRGTRYTNELFQQAAISREKYIVKENAPERREKIQGKMDLLVNGIERARRHKGESEDLKRLLDDIKADAGDLLKEIDREDTHTGGLADMKQIVEGIIREVGGIRQAEDIQIAMRERQAELDEVSSQLNEELNSSSLRPLCLGAGMGLLLTPVLSLPVAAMCGAVAGCLALLIQRSK